MPELPEAETIVRGLRKHLLNARIRGIDFPKARYFRPQLEQPLEHYLGSRIVDIFRHGKSVIFQLDTSSGEQAFLIVRLGMTGQLLLTRAVDRHTHAIFQTDVPPAQFCFRDPRQFGRIFFQKDWRSIFLPKKTRSHSLFPRRHQTAQSTRSDRAAISDEPVADPLKISPEAFVRLFWKRHRMLKNALMSQKLVVGVGNIYADESLFAARLHPKQKIHRLSRTKLLAYFSALVKILEEAIALGGSSISDFVDADNSQGEFQMAHRVYGRAGEKCLRKGCKGIIRRTVIASRSTHYCPKCQRQI